MDTSGHTPPPDAGSLSLQPSETVNADGPFRVTAQRLVQCPAEGP